MKTQPILIVLTLINLSLLAWTLAPIRPAVADTASSVLRGRALEIVDDQGRVRASLSVLPARSSRMVKPRPKPCCSGDHRAWPPVGQIGASEETTGLSFAGPTNTKDAYLVLKVEWTTSSLRLRNEEGREHIVKP
jgi:hypothetical protein